MNVAELLQIPSLVMPEVPIVQSAGAVWTYADFSNGTNEVADWLRSQDVGPGSVVSTVQMLSAPHLALMFATFSVGAVFNPLNYRSRADDLGALLALAKSTLIVADARYLELVRASVADSGSQVASTDSAPSSFTPTDELWVDEVDDDADAVLLFTSGTTGTPKPVRLRHSALASAVLENSGAPQGASAGRTLVSVPTYHVAGLTTVLTSVFMGRELNLLPQFDPAAWLSTVERNVIDHAFCVPTMVKQILDAIDELPSAPDLRSLTTLAYGAAPMPASVITRALSAFPSTCDFVNAYGQTETMGTVTMLLPEDHRIPADEPERARMLGRLASVGRAVPGVSLLILSDAGVPLGAGEVGEVAVIREGLFAEPHRTGDVGYLDDGGYLFLRGRLNDVIIRGGENIDPTEIEHVLEAHTSVAEAAAVGEADAEWGEVVVAYVVAAPGHEADAALLREHVGRHLAGFKVPARVHVVHELPRNSTGKVLKRELRRNPHE